MRALFLSHVIDEKTPLYAGKNDINLGNNLFTMPYHTGTHIDSPAHFIEEGRSVTDFKAEELIFSRICLINVNAEGGYIISPADIRDEIRDCDLLLIKTGFEKHRNEDMYWKNSPGLSPELATWLKENVKSIRAVGVDFISISSLSNRELGREAHRKFLGNEILLIEDMHLSEVEEEPDEVFVFPLRIENADGSPCTVLALMR
jgi:kynurenine formamidase